MDFVFTLTLTSHCLKCDSAINEQQTRCLGLPGAVGGTYQVGEPRTLDLCSPALWTGHVADLLSHSCCPFLGAGGAGILEVKSAGPARGLSLTTDSRGAPSAAALEPHPYQSRVWGRGRKGKGTLEGELEEKFVCTIAADGAAVVRLIHPGLPR